MSAAATVHSAAGACGAASLRDALMEPPHPHLQRLDVGKSQPRQQRQLIAPCPKRQQPGQVVGQGEAQPEERA